MENNNEQTKNNFWKYLDESIFNGIQYDNYQGVLKEIKNYNLSLSDNNSDILSESEEHKIIQMYELEPTEENLRNVPVFILPNLISKESNIENLLYYYWTGDFMLKKWSILRLAELIEIIDEQQVEEILLKLQIASEPMLAYSLELFKCSLKNSSGKESKKNRDDALKIFLTMNEKLQIYYSGDKQTNPWDELKINEWRKICVWLKEASTNIVYSLNEYLLFLNLNKNKEKLLQILTYLLPCGDFRLIPLLKELLRVSFPDSKVMTSYILSNIEDPSVEIILKKALDYSMTDIEKIALTGSLNIQRKNDITFLLNIIKMENREQLWEDALRAIRLSCNKQLEKSTIKLTNYKRITVIKEAVRALEYIGTADSFSIIEQLHKNNPYLESIISATEYAIKKRLSYLKEEPKLEVSSDIVSYDESINKITTHTESNFNNFMGEFFGYLYCFLGSIILKAGQPKLSINLFEIVIKYNPLWVNAYFNSAIANAYIGNYDRAIELLRNIIHINSNYIFDNKIRTEKILNIYIEQILYLINHHDNRNASYLLHEIDEYAIKEKYPDFYSKIENIKTNFNEIY